MSATTPHDKAVAICVSHFGYSMPLLVERIENAIAAAERDAYERAAGEQMERDCKAVCMDCRKGRALDGDTHVWETYAGAWDKMRPIENRMRCRAANIRHEWSERQAALAAAPAPSGGAD
jgi:hypothetical protein